MNTYIDPAPTSDNDTSKNPPDIWSDMAASDSTPPAESETPPPNMSGGAIPIQTPAVTPGVVLQRPNPAEVGTASRDVPQEGVTQATPPEQGVPVPPAPTAPTPAPTAANVLQVPAAATVPPSTPPAPPSSVAVPSTPPATAPSVQPVEEVPVPTLKHTEVIERATQILNDPNATPGYKRAAVELLKREGMDPFSVVSDHTTNALTPRVQTEQVHGVQVSEQPVPPQSQPVSTTVPQSIVEPSQIEGRVPQVASASDAMPAAPPVDAKTPLPTEQQVATLDEHSLMPEREEAALEPGEPTVPSGALPPGGIATYRRMMHILEDLKSDSGKLDERQEELFDQLQQALIDAETTSGIMLPTSVITAAWATLTKQNAETSETERASLVQFFVDEIARIAQREVTGGEPAGPEEQWGVWRQLAGKHHENVPQVFTDNPILLRDVEQELLAQFEAYEHSTSRV